MHGTLPGGYWDNDGRLHRQFELKAMTGREEELLVGRNSESASLVTEVLSRCLRELGTIGPVTPEVVRGLLVADRHFLLLQLRRVAFGDLVQGSLLCPWPDCGRRVSLEFSLAEVPVEEATHRAPVHSMTLSAEALDGGDAACAEVDFRLPNGSDQEELSALLADNEAEVLTLLLSRCILRIGPHEPPGDQHVSALSPRGRAEIEECMERLAPKVEQTVETKCAECTRTFFVPLDVQRFFFGDLRTGAALLYREVHHLAFHYHWSEREIMDMTRDKRRTYIDVLDDVLLEVQNCGT
ncbi:hypothetical protein OHB05_00890 [Streptomyces sp. NBC_00638]|uniref:T4 family baseplate hub assembly chaperone n=1 Tax=unclassified Streptomyces TaxID=2593676 RepID=UPI00224D9533|nr:hypothetical protein [Streptomyces sp. NBC_00638]MCX5001185.1 hypothetical protein [Streptomyces sp. NBC_00638]